MADIRQYPLVCGFSENVIGDGFVAGVRAQGRVLAESSDEGWWASGVNPGAIADHGETLVGAVSNLRRRFRALLIDIANEAPDFETFKSEVEKFFHATDEEAAVAWGSSREAVRAAIRAGVTDLPDLPRVQEESKPTIRVHIVELRPNQNTLENTPQIAA